MNAEAILPGVSIRQEETTVAKCGVGCEIYILAHGVKKRGDRCELQRMDLLSSVWEPGYAASTLGLEDQIQHSSEAV